MAAGNKAFIVGMAPKINICFIAYIVITILILLTGIALAIALPLTMNKAKVVEEPTCTVGWTKFPENGFCMTGNARAFPVLSQSYDRLMDSLEEEEE